MKRALALFTILLVIAAGGFVALRLRPTAEAHKATSAESKGDFAQALSRYVDALGKTIPSVTVPDFNRSKVLPTAVWRKEVADYASWLAGTSSGNGERAKCAMLLEGIGRSALKVNPDNLLSNASTKILAPEQFTALWNGAFFAPGTKTDASHLSLAAEYFAKAFSIIKLSAHTTYTYEVALIDTAANRRTCFTVYPESSTLVLAAPGQHILICKSTFKPGPGAIWYSAPSVIPLTVPAAPSLLSFTLETRVKREASP